MITVAKLRAADPRDIAADTAFTVAAIVRTCRLALENDGSGVPDVVRIGDAVNVLGLVGELLGVLEGGAEGLQREAKRGFWKP